MRKKFVGRIMFCMVVFSFVSLATSEPVLRSTSISSPPQQSRNLGKIITVDNEPGDADYTSIAAAVAHASTGDTIQVFSGTYYEHSIGVTVDQLQLEGISHELGTGNDTGMPVVDCQGSQYIFHLAGGGATVTGFCLQNGSESALIVSSTFNMISNNTIRQFQRDSVLLQGDHNTVRYNTFENNDLGVGIYGCYFNAVRFNNFIKNKMSAYFSAQSPGGINLLKLRFTNLWFGNYWGRPRLAPKIIIGLVSFSTDIGLLLPMTNMDWRPALKQNHM